MFLDDAPSLSLLSLRLRETQIIGVWRIPDRGANLMIKTAAGSVALEVIAWRACRNKVAFGCCGDKELDRILSGYFVFSDKLSARCFRLILLPAPYSTSTHDLPTCFLHRSRFPTIITPFYVSSYITQASSQSSSPEYFLVESLVNPSIPCIRDQLLQT